MSVASFGRSAARMGAHSAVAIAITEDRDHNVWVSVVGADRKLFRIRDLVVQEEFTPEQIPFARLLAADPGGGIWLGLVNGDLAHYRTGKLEVFPLRQDGLPLAGLTVDADGSAWASTGKGLVRWKDREMKTLTTRNGLPCDSVVSSIRDRQGDALAQRQVRAHCDCRCGAHTVVAGTRHHHSVSSV